MSLFNKIGTYLFTRGFGKSSEIPPPVYTTMEYRYRQFGKMIQPQNKKRKRIRQVNCKKYFLG